MFWIVATVFLLGIAAVLKLKGRSIGAAMADTSYDRDEASRAARRESAGDTSSMVTGVIAAGIFILWLLASAGMSVHVVDARNVGVVKTFGSITGQVGEGIQLTWPWQSVEEWDVRLKVVEPDTRCSNGAEKCMDAGSVDVQDVYVSGALNIEVDPRDVQELARNIGRSYEDTIVRNRLYQVVKQTTATYKAQDILAAREEIRTKVRAAMQAELAAYSINVTDFLITNIDFRGEFKEAIEAKVRAEQEALTERNRVDISRAQAEQKAAEAQGEADRLRIEAEGQAAANRLINESLTPLLVQFQALQKLADNVQIALIPSGEGIIIDPATLLQGSTQR